MIYYDWKDRAEERKRTQDKANTVRVPNMAPPGRRMCYTCGRTPNAEWPNYFQDQCGQCKRMNVRDFGLHE